MKKNKLPSPTEHQEAVWLMHWIKLMTPKIPELDLLFAIPNGGARNLIVAKKLKAEGVKAGIPDYFLPVARWMKIYNCEGKEIDPRHTSLYDADGYMYHGLFLELKRANGVPSDVSKAQKEKMRLFEEQGYKCVVAFGWQDASKKILEYLGKQQ